MDDLGFVLTRGDAGCPSSALTEESDSLTVPRSLFFPSVVFGIWYEISALVSRAGSSGVRMGGSGLGVGGMDRFTKGIGGVGGRSASCGKEAVNGLKSENLSEPLREPLHSTGDLIAIILVGELGPSLKETGDEGADETRLITLFCGKTIIPHLLTGRTGDGVNNSGVTGEGGPGGGRSC
jgi:hypothetical protein